MRSEPPFAWRVWGLVAPHRIVFYRFPEPNPMTQLKAVLDCRNFRKHHLAYLDDTLSGDQMATAQRHILSCDSCAAHDTMVRRSLVMARNITTIEPSSNFHARLNARLAEARIEREMEIRTRENAANHAAEFRGHSVGSIDAKSVRALWRSPRALSAIAAGAVIGALVWRGITPTEAPVVALQPVIATQPVQPELPYISPAMLQAMATGNPVFPAAIIIEEAPNQFVNVKYTMSLSNR